MSELFFKKFAAYKETLAQEFSREYCNIFISTFFIEHLRWLLVVKLEVKSVIMSLKSAKSQLQLLLATLDIMGSLYIVT